MSGFKDMKIKNKIMLVNGLLIALLLCMGYVGYFYVQKLNTSLNNLTDTIGPTVKTASELKSIVGATTALSKDVLLSKKLSKVSTLERKLQEESGSFIKGFDTLSEIIADEDLSDELNNTRDAYNKALSVIEQSLISHRAELTNEISVKRMMHRVTGLEDNLRTSLTELSAIKESEFKQSKELRDYEAVEAATKVILFLTRSLETAREYLSTETLKELPTLQQEFEENSKMITLFKERLVAASQDSNNIQQVNDIARQIKAFQDAVLDENELFDKYSEQLELRVQSGVLALHAEHALSGATRALQAAADYADKISSNADEQAARDVVTADVFIGGAALLGLIVSVSLGIALTRSITIPLARGVELAEALAKGDLTQKVNISQKDEIGNLADALNNMVAQLVQIVQSVKNSSDQVSLAADEIATGSMDLSQRTEEQASSLEQTAASIEEMTATVKQNADNAAQANQLAASSSTQAVKGGKVVEDAVEAMIDINQASKKIADIIGVIDEIAFQTNLLSLNAAVEAARAGEQGRGFAVVAGEVGKLAQRSADSAKEIKQLITSTVEKVENGTILVNRSGETLREIVLSVKKVGDIVSDIAAASEEQSSGIDQINSAVTQMDKVTQLNASSVEETATSSNQMRSMAADLNQQVTFFKLERTKERTPKLTMANHKLKVTGNRMEDSSRPKKLKSLKVEKNELVTPGSKANLPPEEEESQEWTTF